MANINVVLRDGSNQTVTGKEGVSVMEILRDANVGDLLALCGGCLSCATCHVYIDDRFLRVLPAASADEVELLQTSDNRMDNSRLSCQIIFNNALDGMTVTVAPED